MDELCYAQAWDFLSEWPYAFYRFLGKFLKLRKFSTPLQKQSSLGFEVFCSLWFWHPDYCPSTWKWHVSNHSYCASSSLPLLCFRKSSRNLASRELLTDGDVNNCRQCGPLRTSAVGRVIHSFPKPTIVSLELKPGSRPHPWQWFKRQILWAPKARKTVKIQ